MQRLAGIFIMVKCIFISWIPVKNGTTIPNCPRHYAHYPIYTTVPVLKISNVEKHTVEICLVENITIQIKFVLDNAGRAMRALD